MPLGRHHDFVRPHSVNSDAVAEALVLGFWLDSSLHTPCPDQAWKLLCRHCAALGLTTPPAHAHAPVSRRQGLTLGDFAAVLRQHRLRPMKYAIDTKGPCMTQVNEKFATVPVDEDTRILKQHALPVGSIDALYQKWA